VKGLIVKSLVVVVLALGASNYLIYLKTGRFPAAEWRKTWSTQGLVDWYEALSFQDWGAKSRRLGDQWLDSGAGTKAAPVKVYKWTDAQGQVHYDQQAHSGAEVLEIHPDDSRMSAPSPVPAQPNPAPLQTNTAPASGDDASVLEKARAAADAMNQRYKEQEQNF
jgi:hypothetical protein